jgi:hypothetical protein
MAPSERHDAGETRFAGERDESVCVPARNHCVAAARAGRNATSASTTRAAARRAGSGLERIQDRAPRRRRAVTPGRRIDSPSKFPPTRRRYDAARADAPVVAHVLLVPV